MNDLPHCETLLLNLENGVLHVTLNRPDSRNAMSLAMVGELRAILDAVRHEPEVRAAQCRKCESSETKDWGGDFEQAASPSEWSVGSAGIASYWIPSRHDTQR